MKRGVFGKIYNAGKHMAKASFELVGLELRTKPGARAPLPPPPLYDDPLEAMYEERGGVAAAFKCPIDKIVDINGFGFAPHHWHPFVATVVERERHGNARAEALLEQFYAAHQPQNAADAIIGFDNPPDLFQQHVPHIYYLMPWCAGSPESTISKVEDWVHKDNVEHGQKDMTLESHGFPQHGPVRRKKMLLELRRLYFLADALRSKGFDRAYGDCLFRVFRRHGEFRFVPDGGGYHRTVVMAALGYPWISARFFLAPALIDVDEAEYWPQVRRGVWTKAQAIAYFNHLFDYNSRDWVRQQTGLLKYSGLTTPTPSETGLTAACRT